MNFQACEITILPFYALKCKKVKLMVAKLGVNIRVFQKKNLKGFKNFFKGVQIFFGGFRYLLKKLFKRKNNYNFFFFF